MDNQYKKKRPGGVQVREHVERDGIDDHPQGEAGEKSQEQLFRRGFLPEEEGEGQDIGDYSGGEA
jgi:hypothetical protein